MMLADIVPTTSSHGSSPTQQAVTSTTSRKRTAHDVLHSDDLPPPTVTEECCAIQMSGSSRSTRRRVLVSQTNATTDPTSQCLDPHIHDRTDPASQCSNRHKRTVSSPLHLGGPNNVCPHCGALLWTEERVRGRGTQHMPIYNKCCRGGRIVLPPYRTPPEPLLGLLNSRDSKLSNHFFDGIRCYNSKFAMTSMGVHVINSINDGRGTYVFKISGQLCHRIGSLMPSGRARILSALHL